MKNEEELYEQLLHLFENKKAKNKLIKNSLAATQKYENVIDNIVEKVDVSL